MGEDPKLPSFKPYGKAMSNGQRLIVAKALIAAQLSTLEWQQSLAAAMHSTEHGESLSAVELVKPEDCGHCWAIATQALRQVAVAARS